MLKKRLNRPRTGKTSSRASSLLLVLILPLALASFACANGTLGGPDAPGDPGDMGGLNPDVDDDLGIEVLKSEEPRSTTPAPHGDLAALVEGNTAFALDIFRSLALQSEDNPPKNLFFSPHSLSTALAMTWTGARGDTAAQMAATLHLDQLGADAAHPAFNTLDQELANRNRAARDNADEDGGDPFTLNVVNALWGQKDYPFRADFLDALAVNYGAGMRLLDFIVSPDPSRLLINRWVEEQTRERIKDLIPEGAINSDTRLVLTNAIYFLASWRLPFEPAMTTDAPFTLADGTTTVTVPMMSQHVDVPYGESDGHQVIELPYVGEEVSMVLILPDATVGYNEFLASLDEPLLSRLMGSLSPNSGTLRMPKFSFESSFSASSLLQDLGMVDAFTDGLADFSGIDGSRDLLITDVVHKAFVAVDEEGTEAAAATAVIVGIESAPMDPFEVTLDRPFVLAIRDRTTGAILFLGSVTDPTAP